MTEEQIEQKAEEIMMQKVVKHNDCIMTPCKTLEDCQLIDFCFEDMVDAFIDGYHECEKEHEWHYMKDVNCYEDLHFPPEEECKGKLLIWKVQVITEKGVKKPICYHCGSYDDLWYEINAYHVIAFKEIVPPKEIE